MVSVLGEHKAAHILRRPVADTECTAASPVVVGAAAGVETSPAAHVVAGVAAAAAAAAAAAGVVVAAAIENSESPHSHSSHIRPTVQEEDVAATARVLVLAQMAIVDYMLVGPEVGQPRQQ